MGRMDLAARLTHVALAAALTVGASAALTGNALADVADPITAAEQERDAALASRDAALATVEEARATIAGLEARIADLETELAATYTDRDAWLTRATAAETATAPPAPAVPARIIGPATLYVADHTDHRRTYRHSAIDLRRPIARAVAAWNANGRVRLAQVRTCAFRTGCVDVVSVRAGATPWGAVTENAGPGRWLITVNYRTLTSSASGKRGVLCHELGHVLGLDHHDDPATGCMYAGMADGLDQPTAAQLDAVRTGATDWPSL